MLNQLASHPLLSRIVKKWGYYMKYITIAKGTTLACYIPEIKPKGLDTSLDSSLEGNI